MKSHEAGEKACVAMLKYLLLMRRNPHRGGISIELVRIRHEVSAMVETQTLLESSQR